MNDHWAEIPLDEITFESTLRAKDLDVDDLRIYGVDRHNGITDDAKYVGKDTARYKYLDHGMFAYNPMRLNIGSIGYCTDDRKPGLVSPDYVVFGCEENFLLPDYMAYYIRSPEWLQWTSLAGVGSVRLRIYYRELKTHKINLPPTSEQKAITHILGTLDDKIEHNHQMNATLEAIARAIFRSWFVDFDPIYAKEADEDPIGMEAETAALFPDAFVETELGPVPEGWDVVPFPEIVDILSGGTPKTSEPEYWDGNINWVSAKDVKASNGRFVLETERQITDLGLQKSSTKVLPKKTTIVTARGSVGNHCLLGFKMAMNQTNYGLRGKTGIGDYFTFFSLGNLVSLLQQHSYGTIFDTITRKTFNSALVVCPSIDLLREFESKVSPLMDMVLSNQEESRTLAEMRDTLLPRLISGEVRVG